MRSAPPSLRAGMQSQGQTWRVDVPIPCRARYPGERAQPALKLAAVAAPEHGAGDAPRRAHAPLQPGDLPDPWAADAAARHDLGSEPKGDIDEGLRRFVGWMRQG